MNLEKLDRRLVEAQDRPERLTDLVVDLAELLVAVQAGRGRDARERDPREGLVAIHQALAVRPPPGTEPEPGYWGGYAAALRDLIGAYQDVLAEAASELSASRLLQRAIVRDVLSGLATAPHTGRDLADRLGKDAGFISRVLAELRDAKLVYVVGGEGQHKPHLITSLGRRCLAVSPPAAKGPAAAAERGLTWGKLAAAFLAEQAKTIQADPDADEIGPIPPKYRSLGRENLKALCNAIRSRFIARCSPPTKRSASRRRVARAAAGAPERPALRAATASHRTRSASR